MRGWRAQPLNSHLPPPTSKPMNSLTRLPSLLLRIAVAMLAVAWLVVALGLRRQA